MTCLKKNLLLLLIAVAISACASAPAPDLVNPLAPQSAIDKTLESQLDAMGYASKSPAKRVGYTRISGWNYVDRQHVTVTFGANKHYLIKFRSPCNDAQHAHSLRFETIMSSITRGDRAYFGGNRRTMQACWIDELYELEKKPREEKSETE